MPRKRKFTSFDEARTLELQIDELKVIAGLGDENHYTTVLEQDPVCCPRCRCIDIERKESRKRIFNDAIPIGNGKYRFAELTFIFNKYRCKNPECRHVFAQDVSFADATSKGTYRFSDAVAKSVMGMSYRQLAESIPFSVTPQALGNVFRSWYEKKNTAYERIADGYRNTPSTLGIITARTQNLSYTVFLNCDEEEVSVLEVIPEIGTSAMAGALAKFDDSAISHFVISCDQVIVEFLRAYYPEKEIVIPGYFFLDAVADDYFALIDSSGMHLAPEKKRNLYRAPLGAQLSEQDSAWVDAFILRHKRQHDAYDAVMKLRLLLTTRWEYKDLFDWAELIPETCSNDFAMSRESVTFFRDELIGGNLFQDNLPTQLYEQVTRFRELSQVFDENTPEVLRARILFIDMERYVTTSDSDPEAPTLSKVIDNLEMLNEQKPKTYDRRRK